MRFYNSNVLSTLLYGRETWHMKTSQEKKLDPFDSKCIRKILGIRWSDFITNEEVRTRAERRQVSSIIFKRRLSRLGHVTRLLSERLANRVLQWNSQGQRRRGRPKMNWRQAIDRDLLVVNRRWSDALRVAADRARWSTWTASRVARRESNEDQVLLAVCPLASFSGRHTVMIFLRSDWIRVER